jgi:hypothetical protein
MSKLSGSQSNLTFLKSKFGSCLGLSDTANTNNENISYNTSNKNTKTDDKKKDEKKSSKKKDKKSSNNLVKLGNINKY